MKQTKRRLEAFSFFNSDGICRHLEKMAAKGWLLDKMDGLGWRYRRIEPMEATFAITYCPKASEFDPEPTEEQKDFFDFCAHTGWELVTTSAQMQIFYNTRPDPTPIETEPELEYEAVCAAAKKSFLPSYFILLAVGILQAIMFIGSLVTAPVDKLANTSGIVTGVAWVILMAICVVELTAYFLWKRKAGKMVEHGIFLDPPNTSKFQRVCLWIVLAVGIWMVIDTMIVGDNLRRVILVVMAGYMFVLIWGVNWVKDFLKKKKASRALNRNVTIGSSFVLAFAMMAAIPFLILRVAPGALFDVEEESRGGMFGAANEEIPLTLGELLDFDDGSYIKTKRSSESILLGQFVTQQFPDFDDDASEPYWLDYEVVKVKVPFLYDMCRNQYLRGAERKDVDFQRYYAPTDPTPWGANEAYQLEDTVVGLRGEYLLCYDDIIVEINLDWDVTEEQMALVGEKLGDL